MATVSKERLAEVFVEVADTLVGEFDLVEFLQMVTSYTSDLVDARAAGLLLAGPQGRLQLMAASDERAQMVELFQVQADEGPCQDCFRTGKPVVNADLRAAEHRWPRFAPRAVAAGYRSVHAFPLRLRDQVIGALNLFGTEVGDIGTADVRIVQSLADVATIGILQERAIRNSAILTEQLHGALNTRVFIEQAKGMLAQIHGGTPDLAFERLRAYSRSHQVRLSDVARAVVSDPANVPELTTRQD
jgi:GAF domain-containing protein